MLEEWILDNKTNFSPEKMAKYICKCFPKELISFYYKDYNNNI